MLLSNQNMKRNNSLKRIKALLKETILPNGSLFFLDRVYSLEKNYCDIIAIEYPNAPKESLASLNSFWTLIKQCYNLHQEGLSAEATLCQTNAVEAEVVISKRLSEMMESESKT